MQRTSLLIAMLLASIAFAGCLAGDDAEPDETTTPGSGDDTTSQNTNNDDDDVPADDVNTPPAAALTADLTAGDAPLLVTFNLTGADADGDPITWTLDADGDGTSDADGDTLPRDVTFNFTTVGNHTALLTVTDGVDSRTANLTITVTAAPTPETVPLPENITISDSITGLWAGATYVAVEERAHNWSFDGRGVENMTISVTFDDPTTIDLDWTVLAPDGTEVVARATLNAPGDIEIPEAGTIRSSEAAYSVIEPDLLNQTGDWTIEIHPGIAVEGGYTVHVTFA